MGLTLDGVGDLLEIGAEEGAEGLEIRNLSGMNLPENIEENGIEHYNPVEYLDAM